VNISASEKIYKDWVELCEFSVNVSAARSRLGAAWRRLVMGGWPSLPFPLGGQRTENTTPGTSFLLVL